MITPPPETYPLYRPVEFTFRGEAALPLAADPPFRVRFSHRDEVILGHGFWDGDLTYRVRFCPEQTGEWTWSVEDARTALDQQAGTFEVTGAHGHGPVRVAERFHFAHADGTSVRPVGTTAYNWLHQDAPLFEATIESIASAGFNKLRFMVLPQAGGYVEHSPTLLPFERGGNGWDVTRPVVGFFRHLDAAVAALDERGIQADVLILNAYDRGVFGFDAFSEEEDAIFLQYLVARLAAQPNVWWSLCNEFDQLERPHERWDRLGSLLAAIDPHDHLRSIHNWIEIYDQNRPWITHASIQNGSATTDFGRAGLYRDAYYKPIVLDEIKYEGDIPERWGHLDGRDLVHQFWITTVSGCYASHGESFLTESGSLHMVEGGTLRGESPARLAFLRSILDEIAGLDPIDKWFDPAHVVGRHRQQYLQYLGRENSGSWQFRIPIGSPGERPEPGDVFTVDVIDTWYMTVHRVDHLFTLTEVQRNDAYDRDSAPVELASDRALALRITRVHPA